MSYCRWSDDDWHCDLYCYESADGGWVTHVAINRVVGEVPHVPEFDPGNKESYITAHNAQMHFLTVCDRVEIGLPFDGETYHDWRIEDFRDRLVELRKAGYRFPDYVTAEVEAEISMRGAG
jgi:hypothetical protein